MKKRGQVSLFIILGIIIVGTVGLGIYLAEDDAEKDRPEQVPVSDIKPYIESCIGSIAAEKIDILASKGGTFDPGFVYKGESHNFLAYTDNKIINKVLTKKDIAEELNQEMLPLLKGCIDLSVFEEQGYDIDDGSMSMKTIIGPEEVFLELTYPVTMEKQGRIVKEDKFSVKLVHPIGKMHSLALHIINQEALHRNFNKDGFMRKYGHDIKIYKKRPYPHLLYTLKTKDIKGDDILFNFGIRGSDTNLQIGEPRNPETSTTTCRVQSDCFVNPVSCPGETIPYSEDSCFPSMFTESDYAGTGCKYEGKTYSHGEAWCDFDDNRAAGNDMVGSRHVKLSCIDGNIIYENCRDYREEFCTEFQGKAQCRVNRWYDCWKQETKEECEDITQRDCTWEQGMIIKSDRGSDRCYPTVSPGFSFWKGNGRQVCDVANEIMDEHIGGISDLLSYKLPKLWMIGVARYCSSMGDCGNKMNIAGQSSEKSFTSTARRPPKRVFMENSKQKVAKPIDVNPLVFLTGNEFDCPSCSQDAMIERDREFIEEIYSLTPADVMFGGYEFHFPHNAICDLWNYERSASRCEECYEGVSECSRYKCRSIGPACSFSYDSDGFPKCSAMQKPEERLKIDLEFPERDDIEQTNKFLGIWGYSMKKPLNPWERVNVTVKTNLPASCSLSFLPNLEMDYDASKEYDEDVEMAMFAGDFLEKALFINYQDVMWDTSLKFNYNTTHNFDVKSPSLYFLDELVNKTTKVSNIMALYNMAKVKSNLGDMKNRLNRYSGIFPEVNHFKSRFDDTVDKLDDIRKKIGISTLNNKKKLFYVLSDLQREPRRVYMFVKCEDEYGRENEKEAYFNFPVTVSPIEK